MIYDIIIQIKNLKLKMFIVLFHHFSTMELTTLEILSS